MGTRSRITVILSKEDRKPGKVLMFDPKKIEYEYKYIDHTGRPRCLEKVEFDSLIVPNGAEAVRMYCQFDGYPSGVGDTLIREYNTYEKAINLVLGGPAESIFHYLKSDGDWGGGYLNCKVVDPSNTRPKTVFVKENAPSDEAYEYKFKDGRWYVHNNGSYYWSIKRMVEKHPSLASAIDVEKLEKYGGWMLVEEYIKNASEEAEQYMADITYLPDPENHTAEIKELLKNRERYSGLR